MDIGEPDGILRRNLRIRKFNLHIREGLRETAFRRGIAANTMESMRHCDEASRQYGALKAETSL